MSSTGGGIVAHAGQAAIIVRGDQTLVLYNGSGSDHTFTEAEIDTLFANAEFEDGVAFVNWTGA